MAGLVLQQEELLGETVMRFPVLYDKSEKGYKEKDVVVNAWRRVAEQLDFIKNGRPNYFLNFYATKAMNTKVSSQKSLFL